MAAMRLEKLVQAKRVQILAAAARRGARNVRLLGSVGRGESRRSSDVDFLVDLERDRSLLDLGGLLTDLEDLLGCRVDVVTEGALHWYIRDRILQEAKPL
jgi:predicted nucleotidyltransferase